MDTLPNKPTLHLLNPRRMTLEHLVEMFRRLTGRQPTLEELDRAKTKYAHFFANPKP